MAIGIIYKTTNQVNGKWYIGKYEGDKLSYLGSGVALTRAIKKYGKEHFRRETLLECEIGNSLAELEEKIILETGAVGDPMSYNIAKGGIGGHTWYAPTRSEEHKNNISKALTGRDGGKRNNTTKNRMSISRRLRSDLWKILFIETGKEVIINCLGEFSKEHDVSGKTLRYSAKENKIVKKLFLVSKLERKNGNS